MKRLMIMSVIACAVVLAPLGMPLQANDAHHPGKTTKTKKSTGGKAKRTKNPSTKANKTSARDAWPGAPTSNA